MKLFRHENNDGSVLEINLDAVIYLKTYKDKETTLVYFGDCYIEVSRDVADKIRAFK